MPPAATSPRRPPGWAGAAPPSTAWSRSTASPSDAGRDALRTSLRSQGKTRCPASGLPRSQIPQTLVTFRSVAPGVRGDRVRRVRAERRGERFHARPGSAVRGDSLSCGGLARWGDPPARAGLGAAGPGAARRRGLRRPLPVPAAPALALRPGRAREPAALDRVPRPAGAAAGPGGPLARGRLPAHHDPRPQPGRAAAHGARAGGLSALRIRARPPVRDAGPEHLAGRGAALLQAAGGPEARAARGQRAAARRNGRLCPDECGWHGACGAGRA